MDGYNGLVDVKDAALERADDILGPEDRQSAKGQIEKEVKKIEGILKTIKSKVDKTTGADQKLDNAVAEAFRGQLDSLDLKFEMLMISYDDFIALDSVNADAHHLEVLTEFLEQGNDRKKDLASLLKAGTEVGSKSADSSKPITKICHNYGTFQEGL